MVPLLPTQLVGRIVGSLTDVPTPTVEALVESLQEDMVCSEQDFLADLLPAGHHMLGLDEAIAGALRETSHFPPVDRNPMGPLPQDPSWASGGDGEDRSTVSRIIHSIKGAGT